LTEWHLLSAEEAIRRLGSDEEKGLSLKEVAGRQEKFGLNRLEEKKKRTALPILLSQFNSLIVWLLIAAAIVSFLFNAVIDGIVIFFIIALNALLGFRQEFKAEKAMEALKALTALQANAIRDGIEQKINSGLLVPGDLVLLDAGDKVPADLRLIEVFNLKVNEAALTGESIPVEKNTLPLKKKVSALSEMKNICFMNSIIVNGRAKGIVVETGMNTEFGKIAGLVQEIKEELTPLQQRLKIVGRWIAYAVIALTLFIFLIGFFFTQLKLIDLLLVSVALAVSAIPEGLPAVITITLAVGMQLMAKKNALVRKMPAVESLGSCNVICSDKTGTLTKGEMTVQKLYANFQTIDVSGEGYSIKGNFKLNAKKVLPAKISGFKELLATGMLCNNARLDHGREFGDPTEIALMVSGAKTGLPKEGFKGFELIDELSFDSERKKMTQIYANGRKLIAYCKGSPESILGKSNKILVNGRIKLLDAKKRKEIIDKNNEFASNGLRVLGFAFRELKSKKKFTIGNTENDLTFIGLQGMIDAPRKESIEAIRLCRKAGIKVIMITGDHKLTAIAVAKQLGLMNDDLIAMIGEELDALTEKELAENIDRVSIFARVNPEHKVKIISALEQKGYFVAMTGDGINDAPALKKADIGIAMGITGTDVSKEASDIILKDDNFATIVRAVKEGRKIYNNIKSFIKYLLSANVGELLVVGTAFFSGLPLPLLPIQILWINLVTDGLPALALGTEPAHKGIMEEKPRKPDESLFKGTKLFIAISGILATIATLISFFIGFRETYLVAITMAFTTMILFELLLVFNCRVEGKAFWELDAFSNKPLVLAVIISFLLQLMVLYVPFFNPFFDTVALGFRHWVVIFSVSLLALLVPLFVNKTKNILNWLGFSYSD